ncbi:hypothetical protein HDV63DRAFT_155132 [Trichoderma sp. SZMC 28014]
MADQNSATESSVAAADTWSIAARSGSPPPVPQPNRGVAAPPSSAGATNETQNSNKDKSQSHLLLGIGSQFLTAGPITSSNISI